MAIRPFAPSPVASASGSSPSTVEILVIRIGRNLWIDASIIASFFVSPAVWRWLANSTIRIPFFVTSPISIIIPIWLYIFIVIPNSHINSSAPKRASGTVNIITNGSLKLSNCAAITRKMSKMASPNANKRLDELSRKFLDSPSRAVLNVSSSTSFAMRSISSSPSPSE